MKVGAERVGIARQAVASVASGHRTEQLGRLSVPTLVIHGLDDVMCDVSGGRATTIPAAPKRSRAPNWSLWKEWDIICHPG